MKNIKILMMLLFNLLLVFVVIPKCSANIQAEVFLSSDKELVQSGEQVEIILNIKNSKTAAFSSQIYFDNTKFDFISGPENINVLENRIITVWYDTKGRSGAKDGELARYVFKAKEDGIANFSVDGEFYSEQGQLIEAEFNATQVKVGANEISNTRNLEPTISEMANTNLETLAIEGALLYPPFDNSVTNYNVEVSNVVENLNMLAIPENENALASIVGKDNLKEGQNEVKVIVTAENGIINKEIIINVYRRSKAEEKVYEEEQSHMQEKLEEAYEIEKVSINDEQDGAIIEESKEMENKNYWLTGAIITALVIGVIFVVIYNKKFKKLD